MLIRSCSDSYHGDLEWLRIVKRRIVVSLRWTKTSSAKLHARAAKACQMRSAASPKIMSLRPRRDARAAKACRTKRSFSKDHELASEAGRKGGQASGGNFANDKERASEAGRRGGESSHGKR
jgi:general stress protein YciG